MYYAIPKCCKLQGLYLTGKLGRPFWYNSRVSFFSLHQFYFLVRQWSMFLFCICENHFDSLSFTKKMSEKTVSFIKWNSIFFSRNCQSYLPFLFISFKTHVHTVTWFSDIFKKKQIFPFQIFENAFTDSREIILSCHRMESPGFRPQLS